jgi:hypothetical protein
MKGSVITVKKFTVGVARSEAEILYRNITLQAFVER